MQIYTLQTEGELSLCFHQVISGGAQEEISLQQLMEQVNMEVRQEAEAAGEADLDYGDLSKKVHAKLKGQGIHQGCSHQLQNGFNYVYRFIISVYYMYL